MDEPQQSPAPGPVEEAQVDSSDESDDEQFSSDQFILQKYEDEFEAILEEFGQWDREDVLMAFNMASGYPNMARAILNVGFCLKKLPSFIQAQIFTPKEDQLFLSNQNGALSALVALKGRTSVENRLQFLRHRTVGQDPEPL